MFIYIALCFLGIIAWVILIDIFNKEYKDFNSILELKIKEISNGT